MSCKVQQTPNHCIAVDNSLQVCEVITHFTVSLDSVKVNSEITPFTSQSHLLGMYACMYLIDQRSVLLDYFVLHCDRS